MIFLCVFLMNYINEFLKKCFNTFLESSERFNIFIFIIQSIPYIYFFEIKNTFRI
jgi:hypothetical protein